MVNTPSQEEQYASDMIAGLETPSVPIAQKPVDTTTKPLTVEEAKTRQEELTEQEKFAKELESMQGTQGLSVEEIQYQVSQRPTAQKEAKTARTKVKILQDYIDAQKQLTIAEERSKQPGYTVDQQALAEAKKNVNAYGSQVADIVDKKIAPFLIDLSVKGGRISYNVNVPQAIQAGVKETQLKKYVSPQIITQAKQDIKEGKTSWEPEKTWKEQVKSEELTRFENTQAKKVFERTHTEVGEKGSGDYLPNKVIEEIKQDTPDLYKLLMDKGLTVYNNTVRINNEAINTLNKYPVMIATYDDKGIKTYRPSAAGQLDLVKAYQDGRINEIKLLFGNDTINEIKEYLSVKSAKNEYSKYNNLNLAIMNGMSDYQLKKIFTPTQIEKARGTLNSVLIAQKKLAELEQKEQSGNKLTFNEQIARVEYIKTIESIGKGVAAGVLATIIPQGINKILDKYVNRLSKLVTEQYPAVISIPTRYAIGWFVERPLYATSFTFSALGIIGQTNPVKYAGELANGIGTFFKTIPSMIKADPERAANLAGVFVSPNTVKSIATRFDPTYVPYNGMSLEFRAAKLPVTLGQVQELIRSGKLTEVKIANAITKAQKALANNPKTDAIINIPGTGLTLTAKTTPWLKQFGNTFFHATPDYNPYLKDIIVRAKNKKEPALFTSQRVAGRFALTNASGMSGVRPAIISIFTKDGIKDYPVIIKNAKNLVEMERAGFNYLGSGKAQGAYSVIKTYARRFEDEVLIGIGTQLTRVKNLKSRILGVRVGEFVTVLNGVVMPIMRFSEKGAKIPKVSISKLAAIRVETFINTIKQLRIDNKTLSLYLKKERGLSLNKLAEEFDRIGKEASKGKKGQSIEIAYRKAVDDAMAKELRAVYNLMNKRLEVFYRNNPERFEEVYNRIMTRSVARAYGIKLSTRSIPEKTELINRPLSVTYEKVTTIRPKEIRTSIGRIDRQLASINRVDTITRIEPDRVSVIQTVDRDEPTRIERKINGATSLVKAVTISNKDIKDIKERKAPICWRQGIVWWVVKHPYKSRKDVYATRKKPPGAYEIKGIGSAYKTIQALGGNPNIVFELDLGIVKARISNTSIAFKRKPIINKSKGVKQIAKVNVK